MTCEDKKEIYTSKKTYCSRCKYRTRLGYSDSYRELACQYILVEGKMRGCDARHCDKFVKGEPIHTADWITSE